MIIRSKAPLRLSFAGGGTDVAPFKDNEGGCVLSTTINKYAFGSLQTRADTHIMIYSRDYDMTACYSAHQRVYRNGRLSLVKAAIQKLNETNLGVQISLHSDAPPGSGLGSSSAMVVTLIGLFVELLRKPLTSYDIAQMAYRIERIDLKMVGGMQDQYAAAFGGFNFIEFNKDRVIVNPLRIDATTLNELHYNLLLCHIGRTRLSEKIIREQIDNYLQNKIEAITAMKTQKEIAINMKNSLLTGKLNDFASLLDCAWITKKKMANEITNPKIDEMYETAKKNGAIGGKVLGAGGGGYLIFYCSSGRKHHVAEKLKKMGGEIVDFGFDFNGLQTWTAEDARPAVQYAS
jgi:D-glycero-alpha-D-manno-heptose-7-phosphate kinase